MIAVIADDLTGAAEIGGIALRHGLSVVMDTKVHSRIDVDVLVIATDCRSKGAEEAAQLIREATINLLKLEPELIFKKTDSLLRGHVAEELLAQMEVSGKSKVLLLPANPSLKRTIQNGIYYADNTPLNESHLANAARNKIATSGVLDLLGREFDSFSHVISLGDPLPAAGLIIGNTLTEDDLDQWARRLDADTIPAGGGGFFNAVLKSTISSATQNSQNAMVVGTKIIYVCGSAFPLSKASVKEARANGRHVSYMPADFFCPGSDRLTIMEQWTADIISGLKDKGRVIIAVDEMLCGDFADLSNQIRLSMAAAIDHVLQKTEVHELVIEGGATASSIIERLDFKRFFPEQELAQGVIRMKVEGNKRMFLTMKPGSYQWPASIWKSA